MTFLPANAGRAPLGREARFARIQATRFFAAALVVVDHSLIFFDLKHPGIIEEPLVRYGGWIGGWAVSLFFAISGFVITHSSFGQPAGRFLAARALRIYPAFWLACLVCAALKLGLFGSFDWEAEGVTFRSLSLLPLGHHNVPLRIEWSLIYEVFFYALIGLFLLLRPSRDLVWLAVGWLAAILAVAASPYDYSDRFPSGLWAAVSDRNLPFIAGMLLYFACQHPAWRRVRPFLPVWGVAAALFAQVVSGDFWVMATHAVSSGLLLAWIVQHDLDRPVQGSAALPRLGDASYGLYLLHVTILAVVLEAWGGAAYPAVTLGCVILFALAGGLLFGAVEQAMHDWLRRLLRRTPRERDAFLGRGRRPAD